MSTATTVFFYKEKVTVNNIINKQKKLDGRGSQNENLYL